jgi:hypothetical protein
MQKLGVINPKTNEKIQRNLDALLPIAQRCSENAINGRIGDGAMKIRTTEKSVRAKLPTEVPLDETRVEFDEDKSERIAEHQSFETFTESLVLDNARVTPLTIPKERISVNSSAQVRNPSEVHWLMIERGRRIEA